MRARWGMRVFGVATTPYDANAIPDDSQTPDRDSRVRIDPTARPAGVMVVRSQAAQELHLRKLVTRRCVVVGSTAQRSNLQRAM